MTRICDGYRLRDFVMIPRSPFSMDIAIAFKENAVGSFARNRICEFVMDPLSSLPPKISTATEETRSQSSSSIYQAAS